MGPYHRSYYNLNKHCPYLQLIYSILGIFFICCALLKILSAIASDADRQIADITFSNHQGLEFSQQVLKCLHFHVSLRTPVIRAVGLVDFQIGDLRIDVSHRNKVISSTSTLFPKGHVFGFSPRLAYHFGGWRRVRGGVMRRCGGCVTWRLKLKKSCLKSFLSWMQLNPWMGSWNCGVLPCSCASCAGRLMRG